MMRFEPGLLKCVEDVILVSDAEATDRLIEKASRILDEKNSVRVQRAPEGPEADLRCAPCPGEWSPRGIRGRADGSGIK